MAEWQQKLGSDKPSREILILNLARALLFRTVIKMMSAKLNTKVVHLNLFIW